jgi:hypothetical protein
LKRWGFTPQRPLKKAYEQSPEAVAKWVNEEYPKIAAQAIRHLTSMELVANWVARQP